MKKLPMTLNLRVIRTVLVTQCSSNIAFQTQHRVIVLKCWRHFRQIQNSMAHAKIIALSLNHENNQNIMIAIMGLRSIEMQ